MSMEISLGQIFKAVGLFIVFLIVAVIVTSITKDEEDPVVKAKRIAYEGKQYDLKTVHLERNLSLRFWGTIGFLSAMGLTMIILGAGHHRAKVRQASIFYAKIGKSDIPVHIKQIESGTLQEELKTLAHAEELKQSNKGLEKAWEIHCALADLETQRIRALASSYKAHVSGQTALSANTQDALPIPAVTMHELIHQGMLGPGTPIPFGHIPSPASDIISIGVAGWQGSGKSNTVGFLTGAFAYTVGADCYVIDPHKDHPESVSTLLKPLEISGRLHTFTPFDTPIIVEKLDTLLTDRLNGSSPCDPPIVLVIDELPRLSKFPVWDKLTALLLRFVTETRKANMTFIGASHIWTGKYFNGKAEIRQCLNSMLILPTKPSQAELLLEDTQEKKLVKALQHPGQGLLSLNMHSPELVNMPYCTPGDMTEIAGRLSHREPILDIDADPVLTRQELKAGRERLKLTQGEFGVKVGLSQKKISRLENGESDIINLNSDALDRIVDVLDGVDIPKKHVIDFASKARAKAV